MDIDLLLARADDHAPALDGGLPQGAASCAAAPRAAAEPASFADFSDDPNDLLVQRWGIVAPEGPAGDRLLDLVAPLRAAREAAQGGAPARIYRAPRGLDAAAAARWKRAVYRDESVPDDELPRYLLVLGDLDDVSLDLQQALASDLFVGRLACATDAGYAAYVEKVRVWEARQCEARARALFFGVRDGTTATAAGHRALIAPSVARCRAQMERGAFKADAVHELAFDAGLAAKDGLLTEASRAEPAMLFTMSHGLGPPRGGFRTADERRALQGAMSLGAGVRLAADDIAGARFLPGGVWFLLACYGGGTPSSSAYRPWLARLRDAGGFGGRVDAVLAGLAPPGSPPFVAALARTALESPEGPLAVIAHVDLAWTYAFQDQGFDRRDRPSRFQGLFRSLIAGARVGAAHQELVRFAGEAALELAAIDDDAARDPPDAARSLHRASLWMLRQDLAGYVVLGDPAVRLPVPP